MLLRVFLIALGCVFAAPAAASAAVTLGPSVPNPEPKASQAISYPNGTVALTAAAPAGTQLAAPAAGVITSWQFYTDKVGPEAAVQLYKLTPAGGKSFAVSGTGPLEPIAAVDPVGAAVHNVPHTFATRVPIAAGQILGIGIFHPPGSAIEVVLPPEFGSAWKIGCLGCGAAIPTDGSPSEATTTDGQWVAMNAQLEPDVDADGYGDETQDSCVGVCAPVTPISNPGTPPAVKKKCKKGKKLKRGKCVKKKKRKRKKPKK